MYGTAWVTWASSETPETREPRMIGHDDEHAPGVAALGGLEVGDAVRDRLEAGQRRAAVGEGPAAR